MAAFGLTPLLDSGAGPAQNPLPEANPWISGVRNGFSGFSLSRTGTGGFDCAGVADKESRWPTVFGADQEVWCQLPTLPAAGDDANLYVRITNGGTGAMKGYQLQWAQATAVFRVSRISGGTTVIIDALTGIGLTAGDWVGLSAIGQTIALWMKKGTGDWVQKGEVTDSVVSGGGQIGMGLTDTGHTGVISNFGGGTVGLAPLSDLGLAGRGAIR